MGIRQDFWLVGGPCKIELQCWLEYPECQETVCFKLANGTAEVRLEEMREAGNGLSCTLRGTFASVCRDAAERYLMMSSRGLVA